MLINIPRLFLRAYTRLNLFKNCFFFFFAKYYLFFKYIFLFYTAMEHVRSLLAFVWRYLAESVAMCSDDRKISQRSQQTNLPSNGLVSVDHRRWSYYCFICLHGNYIHLHKQWFLYIFKCFLYFCLINV